MLLDQINADLKAAMIARDELKKTTLQGLKSSIKYVEIDQKLELDDDGIMKVLQKEAKKRKESIMLYEKGGNSESAAKEAAELAVIEAYLPEQISEADIEVVVEEVLAGLDSPTIKDMGQVMAAAKAKLGSQADGGVIAQLVKAKLGS